MVQKPYPFKLLCWRSEPQRHLISDLYTLMFSNCNPKMNKASQYLEQVALDLSVEDWEHVYTHIHKGSSNVTAQENGYKMYSRWYRTPNRLHKYELEVHQGNRLTTSHMVGLPVNTTFLERGPPPHFELHDLFSWLLACTISAPPHIPISDGL